MSLALRIRDQRDEVAAMLPSAFFAHNLAGEIAIAAKPMQPTSMLAVHATKILKAGAAGLPTRRPMSDDTTHRARLAAAARCAAPGIASKECVAPNK
jgi:hypothetical protein